MAHELLSSDNLILTGKPAWHGLGRVLPEAPTVKEACDLAFPWYVESRDMYDGDDLVTGYKRHVRSDNGYQLGVVSDTYKIVQPQDMAEFADALGTDVVKVETAGSIQGGKRLWFLCRGESFKIGTDDTIVPYLLLSNSYDGTTAFRVTPTTVRVVCSNTLHAVIPKSGDKLGTAAIVLRHTTNIMDRIAEAKAALESYSRAIEITKDVMLRLATTPMSVEVSKEYFFECYERDFGKVTEGNKAKAMSAYDSFSKRYDDGTGHTAWGAANAYSGLVQHDKKSRGKNDDSRVEKRVESNLFGLNAARTFAAFETAFRHTQ